MARNKRYLMSGGLAFTEQGDMNKLSRLAARGWLLESFAPLGYTLRKGSPAQLDYCVDYQSVPPHELDGYTELFEAGGWTRVCSLADIHIFSAKKGTEPIYSDRDTNRQKYLRSVKNVQPLLVVPLLTLAPIVLLVLAHAADAAAWFLNTLIVLLTVGTALSVPILMTYVASRLRLSQAGKRKE